MKGKIGFLLCLLIVAANVFADDKGTYEQLLQQEKYADLLLHLQKWEQKEPRNPELYIAYFNYYLSIGRKEGVSIDPTAKKNETVLEIKDPKTGEPVGFINPSTIYDPQSVAKAILKLNQGLEYGADRLDMYFGKIHILNDVYDYKTAGAVLVHVLERSRINGNKWLWSDNEPVEDGKAFLLDNIQDYYRLWLDLRSEEGREVVKRASEAQIGIYPDDIFAYNNLAYTFALSKDYETALGYFLKAEAINPKDVLVLNNIAITYVNMGNKDKAKEYFTKIYDCGTEEEKKYATERMKKL